MAHTQFYRIKGGGGPSPLQQYLLTEWMKFKIFMNSALGQAWNRIYKIFKCHQLFQKLLVMGGGGGRGGGRGELHLCFLFCKIVCHD